MDNREVLIMDWVGRLALESLDIDGPTSPLMSDVVFDPVFFRLPTFVGFKVWLAGQWVEKPVKVWNGSAWVTKNLKVWNGTSWA